MTTLDDRSLAADPQGGAWCAETARRRGESMVATASRVERWLLVEHDGAWGPESVPSSRMPLEAARALARIAGRSGARLLMVRRPGARPSDGSSRQVFAVQSQPGHERVRTTRIETDADLAALRPPYDDHDEPGWQRHDDALYLVCTHGRHDRCCALRGRPVAKELAAAYGEQVWECSHVGGERFAANVVVLPEGLYLGWIEPQDAVAVIGGLRAGRLPPGYVRGRSSLPSPVQAAQAFARAELDRHGVDDLSLEAQESAGPDAWRVQLSGGVRVVVRYDRSGAEGAQLLTCDAEEAKVAPVFRLVSMDT